MSGRHGQGDGRGQQQRRWRRCSAARGRSFRSFSLVPLLSWCRRRCVLLSALVALLVAALLSPAHCRPLHRPLIDANFGSDDDSASGSRVVFVENAVAAHTEAQVDAAAGADMQAEAEAEMGVDASMDPAGHSPFRVRRSTLSGSSDAEMEAEASAAAGGLGAQASTLLEATSAPASHEINIPLMRSTAAPQTVAMVLMEVRARQVAHSDPDGAVSLLQMSEGASQDEMELDALIEADAADAHEADAALAGDSEDMSALELRSRDVPLYQEVLKEKHLATYYGTLRIGNEVFRVLFDTGSCELWIPSDKCTTARCRRHRRYPEIGAGAAGKTEKPKFFGNTRMNIEYISGKVAGPMMVSNVAVGGLTVPGQILGLAHSLDIELLDDVVWDGVAGLAYPSKALVTKGVTPLFDNIMKQKLLSRSQSEGGAALANQFAYYIDDTQGQMTFGGVNCEFVVKNSDALAAGADPAAEAAAIEQCKRSFQFVPVTRQTYWTLTLDDVSLSYPTGAVVPAGQKLKGNCGRFGCRAIVDTGTYLIYTSKFFAAPSAWSSFSHCADTRLLPNITFHFRSDRVRDRAPGSARADQVVSLTLEPKEYVLKFDNSRSKEDCVVGISPDRDAVFTLGQVFLRAYYAVFDRDENRVGFSKIHRKGHDAVNARPSKPPPNLSL